MQKTNFRLVFGYNGTRYRGWRRQRDQRNSLQEVIETVFSDFFDRKINVKSGSWTDAGVHAQGQVAIVPIATTMTAENIMKCINLRLPDDIWIASIDKPPRGFDVIGAAVGKYYQYRIYVGNGQAAEMAWDYSQELNVPKMVQAAASLVGTYDFRSFASAKDHRKDGMRTVRRCEVGRDGDEVVVNVEGDRFMRYMVRNIVGVLVEIGAGRQQPEIMVELLETKKLGSIRRTAPGRGLCLMAVKYG